ncbi:MAG: RraA family protein [Betaproteobacteria bacterium]|nr:RraA family protein [Betaproteobacteria bacterium]
MSDILGPGHVLAQRIRPVRPGLRVLGPAFTLKLPPRDNLGMHFAIKAAQPGDVIIADQEGTAVGSPVGEIVATADKTKGIAGIVLDGVVRDIACLRDMEFPVFALGVYPQQCVKEGPASINLPISCGGVIVNPGDIVLGDDDGVVVIPPERAAEVARLTREKMKAEQKRLAAIRAGDIYPAWLDDALKEAGVQEI